MQMDGTRKFIDVAKEAICSLWAGKTEERKI